MPTQRELNQPSYVWELTPHLEQLVSYNNLLKTQYLDEEAGYAEAVGKWEAESKRLKAVEESGTSVGRTTWECHERNFEHLRNNKADLKLGRERLSYTIGLSVSAIFGYYYNQVIEDFATGYLNKDQFRRFLSRYKEAFDSNKSDLACFKTPKALEILATIKKHLSNHEN